MRQDSVGEPWSTERALEAAADATWVHVGALVRTDFPPETLAALATEGRRLLLDAQGLVRTAALGPLAHGRPDRRRASTCGHSQAERRGSRDARRGHRPGPTPIARRRGGTPHARLSGSHGRRRRDGRARAGTRDLGSRRSDGRRGHLLRRVSGCSLRRSRLRSKQHGRQTTWLARFSAVAARARRSRPSHAFRSVVAHFGGGGTRQAIGSDSLPESSTATTSASPFRRIRQSMTPGSRRHRRLPTGRLDELDRRSARERAGDERARRVVNEDLRVGIDRIPREQDEESVLVRPTGNVVPGRVRRRAAGGNRWRRVPPQLGGGVTDGVVLLVREAGLDRVGPETGRALCGDVREV